MYTVKQVAALTGVPQATLRAWERRYDVVQPARSAGGYRYYDDDQVAVLRAMAQLVRNGVPPSLAARQAGSGTGLARRGQAAQASPAGDLVAAARSLDPVHLTAVIDHALAAGPFDQVVDSWLLPELALLGEAWEAGDLTVAHEHFASAGLMRAISGVFNAIGDPEHAGPVLVGLPPGSWHELGVLAFATQLRQRGVHVIYLGSNVPVEEWVRAATETVARAVVMAVTMVEDVPGARAIADACGLLSPPLAVWVGGPQRELVAGAEPLPEAMSAAADVVQGRLVAGIA